MKKIFPAYCLLVAGALLVPAAQVWGQAHEKRDGSYTLRSSTTASENLSAETARRHGFERSPNRAVIDVTVTKKEGETDVTVPAEVTVTAHNLAGQQQIIPMRNTSTHGWVSYMGTYDFINGEIIDFTVTAQPANSSRSLMLTYRDRMWSTENRAH